MRWKCFTRSKKTNIHDHFEIQSASEGQFRQAGDKEDRRNAFGCTLPFRVIRYARNCRAARRRAPCTRVHVGASCALSVMRLARDHRRYMKAYLSIHDGRAYTKHRLKTARFQNTFDFRFYTKKWRKKKKKKKKYIYIYIYI